MHVHFHHLAVDAVFDKHGEGVRIHEAPPPAKADVAAVARRACDRVLVWLRRHRYLFCWYKGAPAGELKFPEPTRSADRWSTSRGWR